MIGICQAAAGSVWLSVIARQSEADYPTEVTRVRSGPLADRPRGVRDLDLGLEHRTVEQNPLYEFVT